MRLIALLLALSAGSVTAAEIQVMLPIDSERNAMIFWYIGGQELSPHCSPETSLAVIIGPKATRTTEQTCWRYDAKGNWEIRTRGQWITRPAGSERYEIDDSAPSPRRTEERGAA